VTFRLTAANSGNSHAAGVGGLHDDARFALRVQAPIPIATLSARDTPVCRVQVAAP